MSGFSLEGFSYSGKLQDLSDTSHERLQRRFATVLPIGSNRAALDVISQGYFLVGAADRVVEAGSDSKQIVLTAHDIKVGDLIRIKTSANGILEVEVGVKSILDANTVLLDGVLSDDLAAADTFDILRSVPQRFDSTGASLASVVSPPMQFTLNGAAQNVIEDTITPSNNKPLPVKLLDVTGDINITAGDLNVQLSHSGGSADSVQIGDGTEIALVNASGELQVSDDTARTSLSSVDGKLPASLGQKAMAASLAVVIASDQSDISVTATTMPLPTGAATAANQATLIAKDFATETTLAAQSAKLPATLGQKAEVASLSVVLASDQSAVPISAAALPLPTGAATAANQATLIAKDFATETTLALVATETTLAAQSAKLPASLGAKVSADSLSVVLASDAAVAFPTGRGTFQFIRNDYSSTNVTTGAFVELTASLTQACNQMEIFDSGGQTMELATGGGGSEVVRFRIFPGGNGIIPVDGTVFAASTRVSIRAVSATANAGEIDINFYS